MQQDLMLLGNLSRICKISLGGHKGILRGVRSRRHQMTLTSHGRNLRKEPLLASAAPYIFTTPRRGEPRRKRPMAAFFVSVVPCVFRFLLVCRISCSVGPRAVIPLSSSSSTAERHRRTKGDPRWTTTRKNCWSSMPPNAICQSRRTTPPRCDQALCRWARRNSPGVCPLQRLKARWKASAEAKPSR